MNRIPHRSKRFHPIFYGCSDWQNTYQRRNRGDGTIRKQRCVERFMCTMVFLYRTGVYDSAHRIQILGGWNGYLTKGCVAYFPVETTCSDTHPSQRLWLIEHPLRRRLRFLRASPAGRFLCLIFIDAGIPALNHLEGFSV